MNIITGHLDDRYRIIIDNLFLENGGYVAAHLDTACSKTLLFSPEHALELGIGLPLSFPEPVMLADGSKTFIGAQMIKLWWLGRLRALEVFVFKPFTPGTLARTPVDKATSLALLGIPMLIGHELLVRVEKEFWNSEIRIRAIPKRRQQ